LFVLVHPCSFLLLFLRRRILQTEKPLHTVRASCVLMTKNIMIIYSFFTRNRQHSTHNSATFTVSRPTNRPRSSCRVPPTDRGHRVASHQPTEIDRVIGCVCSMWCGAGVTSTS
jgi:hypothetical protein